MTASIFNKNSKIGLITAAALVSILTIISISFVLSAIHTRTGITNAIITPNKKVVSVGKTVEENHTVPLDQIVSGGPPPDGIPSIDNPKFVSIQEADDKFLHDDDLILGLNINGDIRAYTLQILVWHEIVNDNVGGMPVAVTYCPLCFTNQVFKRIIDNNVVAQFGTSGKLYNSNLVMYDRKSKSLWSQVLAEGIVGKYAGSRLQRIPFDIAKWSDWKQ